MPIIPLTSQQTLDRARTFIQSGRGAGMPELLGLIQTLSNKLENISMYELTDLLEKDPVVVTRILAAANTVRHNPGIAPLTSLTHAVHQVGFNKVRNIAMSMMLLDNATSTNSPEQRDAAAKALCAGLISRSCASTLGYADPDLLFACGTLRNIGTVILPAVSIELFREVAIRCTKMPEDIAFRSMFGVTPLELGRRLMNTLHMPEEVVYALRDCQPENLGGVATLYNGRILSIAEFSSQIAFLALSPKSDQDGFIRHSRALARRFERIIPSARDLIDPALEHAHEQLTSLTAHGNFLPVATFQRIHLHVRSKTSTYSTATPSTATITTSVEPANFGSGQEAVTSTPVAPTPTTSTACDDWTVQLAQSTAFESQPESSPRALVEEGVPKPWSTTLQTILELIHCEQAAIFLGSGSGKQALLEHWTGDFGDTTTCKIAARPTDRTIFGVCLLRRETVLIHDATDASLDPYLPDWMKSKSSRSGAFMLLPLTEDQGAYGFIFLSWEMPRKIALSPMQIGLIRSLVGEQLRRSTAFTVQAT